MPILTQTIKRRIPGCRCTCLKMKMLSCWRSSNFRNVSLKRHGGKRKRVVNPGVILMPPIFSGGIKLDALMYGIFVDGFFAKKMHVSKGWCHITNLFLLRIRIPRQKPWKKIYSFQPPTSQANQKIMTPLIESSQSFSGGCFRWGCGCITQEILTPEKYEKTLEIDSLTVSNMLTHKKSLESIQHFLVGRESLLVSEELGHVPYDGNGSPSNLAKEGFLHLQSVTHMDSRWFFF